MLFMFFTQISNDKKILQAVQTSSNETNKGGQQQQRISSHWHTLKIANSSVNKILKHVNTENFVGEDLKFADDSLENRLACTLQIGVYKSSETGTHSDVSNLSTTGPIACYVNGLECCVEEWEPERFAAIRSCFGMDSIEYRWYPTNSLRRIFGLERNFKRRSSKNEEQSHAGSVFDVFIS